MSLTSREETEKRFPNRQAVSFSLSELARTLSDHAPELEFAYLMGSAQKGVIPEYSDLDLAVFARPEAEKGYNAYNRIIDCVEKALPGPTEIDIVFLNDAHCVFRFEALKGKRLFVRRDCLEDFAAFYSLTCREYEDYMTGISRRRRLKNKRQ